MNPTTDKEFLLGKFRQALEDGEYDKRITETDGTIEISYKSPDDGRYYDFDVNYEFTSMPEYAEYPQTEFEPAYSSNTRKTEWDIDGNGGVYVDGEEVCLLSDIVDLTPETKEYIKGYFEVDDAELLSSARQREYDATRFEWGDELYESTARRIISEELDKKEVKSMIDKAVDDILSDTKFRKKVVSITADVLEDFMDNLWTRKPFWKSIIKRN